LPQYRAMSMSVMNFEAIDLRQHAQASCYVKDETVDVEFAPSGGSIDSREGANLYRAGDALLTGSCGERWSVARERFDARYQPLPPLAHGADGRYRNRPLPVLATQIASAFSVRRRTGGDLLHGCAGDWLLQYAPGDWGIVAEERFRRLYRPCPA
jgi:PGDYG protein